MVLVRTLLALGLLTLTLAASASAHARPGSGQAAVARPPAPPSPSAAAVVGDEPRLELALGPVYGSSSGNSNWGARHNWCAVSLPIWVPGVSGTLATGSQEASSDGSFFDRFVLVKETITELQFAFVGRVEGNWKRWWGLADIYGAKIGAGVDWTFASANTEVDLKAVIGRVVAGYEVGREPAVGGSAAYIAFTPYAGVRIYDIELTINAEKASRSWVDGIVGMEVRWGLSPRWTLRLLTDVGTGIDSGSEVSWTAAAEVHFRVSNWFSVFAGYNVLGLTYDRNENGRFVMDITLAGPQVGLTISF